LIPNSCIFYPCSSKRGSRLQGPLTQISAKHYTLIPEPFTLNWETGIGESGRGIEESRNRIRGCGESVVVVLQRRCFFSELRVITLKREKYSILKTTTTTDYHILNLPPLAVSADNADQFFLSTLLYTDQPTKKTAPPPVACPPFSKIRRRADSPLPFPDRGILPRRIGILDWLEHP
jgi:hypothetical protein